MSRWDARRAKALLYAQIKIRTINADKAVRVFCSLLGHQFASNAQ
jgi:hypothetical protein